MAENYITVSNLGRAMERYDVNFKKYTDDKIKNYIRAITFDDETRLLKFYTIPAPITEGTIPYLTVEIPEDAEELMDTFAVSMETPVVPDEGKFRTYVFYQGTGEQKTEVGRVNLEFDTVVESGVVVEATPENPIVIGETTYTSGKFLRLTIKDNVQPVYIALEDIGKIYVNGNGIDIDQNDVISIEVNQNSANGLEVDSNGLKLNLAVAPDEENDIEGSAGAMSVEDKEKVDSITVATEAQIRALFD